MWKFQDKVKDDNVVQVVAAQFADLRGYVTKRSIRKRIRVGDFKFQEIETMPSFRGIEVPKEGQLLPVMPKVPPLPTLPRKMAMAGHLIRGEEEVHTDFIHKQYGVVSERGGFLRYGHLEMIRREVLAHIQPDRMFAIWRVDAPWKSHTKKSIGKPMGKGKGNISYYTTPVRAKRVIFEVAGKCTFDEVRKMLEIIVNALPFPARAMTQEMIEEERKEEARLEKENVNPYTFKYIVQNNMLGCKTWIKRDLDQKYFGKYD